MNENPFASPLAEDKSASTSNSDDDQLQTIARRVFLAWEKLRLVYIALLGMETIACLLVVGVYSPSVFGTIFAGAVICNLAFFLGPVIETYVRWLGYSSLWPRYVMFAGGTLLSALLAFFALFADHLIPDQF